MIPQIAKKPVAWFAVCVACVSGFEGLRTTAYFDVGGVPTACFGETRGIRVGDTFSPDQCKTMLVDRVKNEFGPGVDRCIRHPLPPERKAAFVSFAYNAGVPAFCGSSVARKENVGDTRGACDAMLLWNKVRIGGVLIPSPGLNKRRQQERALCLTGIV